MRNHTDNVFFSFFLLSQPRTNQATASPLNPPRVLEAVRIVRRQAREARVLEAVVRRKEARVLEAVVVLVERKQGKRRSTTIPTQLMNVSPFAKCVERVILNHLANTFILKLSRSILPPQPHTSPAVTTSLPRVQSLPNQMDRRRLKQGKQECSSKGSSNDDDYYEDW